MHIKYDSLEMAVKQPFDYCSVHLVIHLRLYLQVFCTAVSSFVMLIKVFIKLTDAMQIKLLLMIIVVLWVLAIERQWYLFLLDGDVKCFR